MAGSPRPIQPLTTYVMAGSSIRGRGKIIARVVPGDCRGNVCPIGFVAKVSVRKRLRAGGRVAGHASATGAGVRHWGCYREFSILCERHRLARAAFLVPGNT